MCHSILYDQLYSIIHNAKLYNQLHFLIFNKIHKISIRNWLLALYSHLQTNTNVMVTSFEWLCNWGCNKLYTFAEKHVSIWCAQIHNVKFHTNWHSRINIGIIWLFDIRRPENVEMMMSTYRKICYPKPVSM